MKTKPTYPDFEYRQYEFLDKSRPVLVGGEGPAVIVIHESPGLYPAVADFGRRLVGQGFTVFMPSLTGRPGRDISIPYALQTLAVACVSREFAVWATGRNSPVTDWLRLLAHEAHRERGGPGVGAVGMCLTGGFALAMAADPVITAPALSQPSLPFPITPRQRRDPGVDCRTLERVADRVRNDGLCVMGLRFTGDRLCPGERFTTLKNALGDGFVAIEIDSRLGNPDGISPLAHSVLAFDYRGQPEHPTRRAELELFDFFRQRLLPAQV